MQKRENHLSTPTDWRAASQADRLARAERLCLPSGAVILAVKPEPLEWIISGRLPQRLLGVVLGPDPSTVPAAPETISREDILELARFSTQLVKASIVDPPVGEGPDEIRLEEIPTKDRAYIFQWACRALGQAEAVAQGSSSGAGHDPRAATARFNNLPEEELSSASLERFRQK
jgi:hypothetical protein